MTNFNQHTIIGETEAESELLNWQVWPFNCFDAWVLAFDITEANDHYPYLKRTPNNRLIDIDCLSAVNTFFLA